MIAALRNILLHCCVVVQLFTSLETDTGHRLSSEELSLALLSWLLLTKVSTAHAAWQRHSKLTAHMTASQQQEVFHAILRVLQEQSDDAAADMAQDCCLLAAKLKWTQSYEQVQQLVDALLAGRQHKHAYHVSRLHFPNSKLKDMPIKVKLCALAMSNLAVAAN